MTANWLFFSLPGAGLFYSSRKEFLSMKLRNVFGGRLLALILTAAVLTPAARAAQSFCDFRIDAAALDFPSQSVSVQIYRQDTSGAYQVDDSVRYDCTLNRVTEDASFYIQPKVGGVWVTVEYLTDLNGDGVYELLDGEGCAAPSGLVPNEEAQSLHLSANAQPLAGGRTYVLEAQTLKAGYQEAVELRSAGGACALDAAQAGGYSDLPLYLINLHRTSSETGSEEVQSYYLKIYGPALIPDDVSPRAWYYDAVEFVLARGYLSGTSDGSFQPNGLVTRAQLAQILWRMAGSLSAEPVSFQDVDAGDWYSSAVSWCCRTGIMSGLSADTFGPSAVLSRDQLALILHQFAEQTNTPLQPGVPLTGFSDAERVSSWARDGMEWAVANGLLTGDSQNALNPKSGVTRAQIASVLYTYCQAADIQ